MCSNTKVLIQPKGRRNTATTVATAFPAIFHPDTIALLISRCGQLDNALTG